MPNTKKYLLQFVIICVGCLLVSYGLSQVPSPYLNARHFWLPTVFFALTTFGINAVLVQGDKNSQEFVFKTLAMSMARLLASLMAVLIYTQVNKSQALAFACHFMLQYLVFTIFEISCLLKYIKKEPGK